jgi:hypothetical protein
MCVISPPNPFYHNTLRSITILETTSSTNIPRTTARSKCHGESNHTFFNLAITSRTLTQCLSLSLKL